MDEKTVKLACQKIIDSADKTKAVNYAVEYARVALRLSGDSLRTQLLYVISNITHWRSHEAKEVREIIKQFIKG